MLKLQFTPEQAAYVERIRCAEKSFSPEEKSKRRGGEVLHQGSHCTVRRLMGILYLQTDRVLIWDISTVSPSDMSCSHFFTFAFIFLASVIWGLSTGFLIVSFFVLFGLAFLWKAFLGGWLVRRQSQRLDSEARQKIEAYASNHPDWHIRLYKLVTGYRLMLMHKLFEEDEIPFEIKERESEIAQAMQIQNAYYKIKKLRVSPSDQGVGQESPEFYLFLTWPGLPECLLRRQLWIENYNKKADQFATCRFLKQLGSNTVHPAAEYVRAVHDKYCRAETELPLA
jgi:hypothetical protein